VAWIGFERPRQSLPYRRQDGAVFLTGL